MSLTSELQRLQNNVTGIVSDTHAILDAIAAKGVVVPEGSTLHDCPGLIASISKETPTIPDTYKRVLYI